MNSPPAAPAPNAPAPAPKPDPKKGRGCLRALGIALGIVFVVTLVAAGLLYRYVQTPEGRKIFVFAKGVTKVMAGGFTAPGAKELRALGCQQAIVVDGQDLDRVVDEAEDAGTPPEHVVVRASPVIVSCSVGLAGTSLTCVDVFKAYQAAVPPSARRVAVTVQSAGGKKICDETFDPDGSSVTWPSASSKPTGAGEKPPRRAADNDVDTAETPEP